MDSKWSVRDTKIIKSYMRMQQDYLELERLVLENSYDNVQNMAKVLLGKMPQVDKSKVCAEISSMIALEKQRNKLLLEQYRLNFKKKASEKYRELRNSLLRIDLYGIMEESRIDDVVLYKMLGDGYCPLVSGSSKYKIFWHSIVDFDNEYNEKFNTFTSEFSEDVGSNVKFVDEPNLSFFQKVKNFFSKKDTVKHNYNRKKQQKDSDISNVDIVQQDNRPASNIVFKDVATSLVKQSKSVCVGG